MSRCLPVVLGLLAAGAGPMEMGRAQTLEQALAAAYANNPTLMAQRAKLRATDEQVPQALADWRPSVELNGDIARKSTFTKTRALGITSTRSQIRTPRGAELSVTQPIFRGFRTEAAVSQAENTVKAERARLHSIEQQVLLDAVTSFMAVVREQAVLDLNISNEQVLRRQLEATQDRFEVGEITRTDVHQAEARLAGATADRVKAEGDLEASRAGYRNVVGAAAGRLQAPGPVVNLPEDKDAAIETARAYQPSVIIALFDERAARDEVAEIKGELLPSLSLVGRLSRDLDGPSNTSRADQGSITAELSIPIFQEGLVYSRLRAARQTLAEELQQVEQARRDAIETASRSWEALATARARITSFSAQVKAAEVALDGVQREASVGSRTVLDVLDAEQELLDANVDLVRARRDETVAAFELKAAVGDLTARRLDLPVDFYDPARHYREVRGKWTGGVSSGDAGSGQAGGAPQSE